MRYFLSFLLASFLYGHLGAQITVSTTPTAQQLAELLAGSNLVVSNATLTGSNLARGSFANGSSVLGMTSGVILSTGRVSTAPGPNAAANTSNNLGVAGTAQMTTLAGAQTYDAITLEFDFTVQSDFIQFNYVFASEEYPEYAPPNNSSFNDVFAFFISGPGITGEENIALIPNTSTPVAINNINAVTNNQFYIDNTGGQEVSFDAYTTLLTARREGLTPCSTYHLKLVIADAGDEDYNSAVLLQENSLVQGIVDVNTNTINSDNIALEGCIEASFTFSLDQPSSTDKTITYQIAGTATNGVDYSPIATSLTIPAGQTQAQVFIHAVSDGLVEGQETILIIYKPEICADWDTAFLYINDAQPITYTLDGTDLGCYGNHSGEILINASGGFPPYTYHVKDQSGITTQYTSNPVTGLDAGQYVVYVYDSYGCKAEALVIGGLFNAGTTFLPDGSGAVYTSTLSISGFNPGQTLNSLSEIQNICLNMEHSYMGDLSMVLIAPGGQSVQLKDAYDGGSTDLGEPIATGPVDGSASSTLTDPGVGYDYCFNATPMYGTMGSMAYTFQRTFTDLQGHTYTDYYLPAGSYTPQGNLSNLIGTPLNGNWVVQVTDHMYLDNGYIFNWSISFIGNLPDTVVELSQPDPIVINHFVTQASCGDSNGSINVAVSGDYSPFSYLWNTGATTEDIGGLSAGAYSITVSDAHGCQDSSDFAVSNSSSLSLTSVVTPVYCAASNSGSVNIQVNGGTPTYSFLWSNGATTEDISSLAAGSYSVTITDAAGCQMVRLFEVTQNPQLTVTLQSLSNEFCSTSNGSIYVLVNGGSGSYGYQWSNGASTASLSSLHTGTYAVTVTDAYGCTATGSWFVSNDVSNCEAYCYLNISQNNIVDDQCGAGTGSIDITVNQAAYPYLVQWSNGQSSEDIGSLVSGSYTITVTDANQCVETATFTVANQTGTLSVQTDVIQNETCGTGNGSIGISVSGGALPYSFQWSNGSTSEDISSLDAGTYTLTLTDANNCTLITTFPISNDAGNLSVVATLTQASCGNANGAITQNVTGGFGNKTYSWSNGSVLQSLTGLLPGTYSCTITDAGGCSLSETYYIANTSGAVSISSSVITNETCGGSNGAINLTCSGTGLSYLWSNGAISEDISGLSAGTYSCTISNTSGCTTQSGPLYVFNAPGTLDAETLVATDEVCGNGLGYITISVTGGTAPLDFNWSNGSTSQSIYSLHAGTYMLTITDAAGCQLVFSESIANQQGTLDVQNAVVTNETCGQSNGAVNIYVVGGTTPYAYLWNNAATTQDINAVPAGTYAVTITDAAGCTVQHSEIIENEANGMVATYQITNEMCGDGTGAVDLTVSGGTAPYSYFWSNASVNQDINALHQGQYYCTITDQSSCELLVGPVLVNNASGGTTVSSSTTNETCSQSNGSITLSVSGGVTPYSFIWSNGATTQSISGLQSGTYAYTVTSAGGCSVTGMAVVEETAGTLIAGFVTADELCGNNAGSIDITVSGGTLPFSYIWNDAVTSEDRSGLSAGTYVCTISDAAGCSVVTSSISIADQPGTLQQTGFVVTNEVCNQNNGRINFSLSGGTTPYSFTWSNGAHTEDITGLTAGLYIVTVTDAAGCSFISQGVVIDDNGAFGISNAIVTNEHCSSNDGLVDISISGGSLPYSYVWSNGAITQDISSLSAGDYSIFVTDDGGCSDQATYSVIDQGSDLAVASASITNAVCAAANGEISVTVTGGVSPYTFDWSNGEHSQLNTMLSAGNYGLTVTDASGCQVTSSYQIDATSGTLTSSAVTHHENCGDGSAYVLVSVSGGATPYTYEWNTGASTEDLVNIHAGNYSLTITDLYGCEIVMNESVLNITTGLMVTLDTIVDEHCLQSDGSIDLSVSGGMTPLSILWSNGAVSEDIAGISAGSYTVTVTDATGCTASLNGTVNNLTGGHSLSFSLVNDEMCNDGSGFIDIEITGGTAPYTYLWSNGAVSQDLSGIHAGLYQVSVSDLSGCSALFDFTVNNTNSSGLSVNGVVTDTYCNASGGMIDLSVSGGIQPLSYDWSNGSTTQDISGLTDGTFTVTVTDDAGCSTQQSFAVQQLTNTNLAFYYVWINPDYCGQGNGEIMWDGLGGNTYTYFIDNAPNTMGDAWALSSGWYEVSVLDENGCRIDSTVFVGNDTYFSVSEIHTNELCGAGDASIDLSVSGATAPTFLWSNGAYTEDLTGVGAGSYTCTVSESGCSSYITVLIEEEYTFDISATVLGEYCSDSTGSIDQTPDVLWNPLQFAWSNGAVSEDLNNLGAGIYTCTITDLVTGCERTETYIVPSNSSGMIVNTVVLPDTCSMGNGNVENIISGGSGVYDWYWTHGPVTSNLNNLTAGVYMFVVSDLADGCTVHIPVEVNDVSTFYVLASVTDATCAFCNDGMIDITPVSYPGFSNAFTYQWNFGATSQDGVSLIPATYSVTVTSSSGCDTVMSFIVSYPDQIDETAWEGLIITPNPADAFVNISLHSLKFNGATLYIVSSEGKRVFYAEIFNNTDLLINTAKWNPGSYRVIVEKGNAMLSRQLLIVR